MLFVINMNKRTFRNLENNAVYVFNRCNPTSDYLDETKYKELTQDEIDEFETQNKKQILKFDLKTKRAALAESSTVEYQGKTYSNSQNSRNAISNIIQLLVNDDDKFDYFTYPNQEKVSLSKTDFKNILALIIQKEIDLRNNEMTANAKIDKLKTISKCQEIVDNFS
jgi:hypothetical protein